MTFNEQKEDALHTLAKLEEDISTLQINILKAKVALQDVNSFDELEKCIEDIDLEEGLHYIMLS